LVEANRQWTAALVVIGDEILSGRTQDRNVAQLATWLNDQGIRLAEVRIVADDSAAIGAAVNALRTSHDYLFTTGGIGPTHDDITVDAIAAAFNVPVVVHPEARRILEDYYRGRPGGLTEARLRMARVPDGAELIANPSSGAPGVKLGNVYILAGVPHIAASMVEALTGMLEGGRPMVSVTIGARAAEATSPICCARPRRRIPALRSAATRSSATGASAPISSFGRRMERWRGRRRWSLPRGFEKPVTSR
jgi:molybdenum cofactor synthesis domain-containing protein